VDHLERSDAYGDEQDGFEQLEYTDQPDKTRAVGWHVRPIIVESLRIIGAR
jgi:hypothetical protein